MSYYLDFHPKALKEWKNLNQSLVYENLKDRI